jgi:hypothetical protein
LSAVPELPGGFSPRTVRWLAAAAAASFAALLLLAFFGRDLSRPPSAGPSAFGDGVLGYRGVADFLAALGLGVSARETRAARETGPDHPLVLAEPDPERTADPTHRLQALADEAIRHEAPLVLVLPKWTGAPLRSRPGWVARLRLRPAAEALRPLAALVPAASAAGLTLRREAAGTSGCSWWGRGYDVDLAPAQLLHGERLISLVACRGGVLVGALRLAGGRTVLVVADSDLLNNQGLARAGHAALVHALFVDYLRANGVVFDETIHGFERASGLFAEVFRFPLALVLVQSLVLLAAILWAGSMVRFGKPLPRSAALAAGKEVLIDNTARLLAEGGHAAAGLARYYRQTIRAVAAELHLPADGSERETAARLERIAAGRRLAAGPAELERRLAEAGDSAGSAVEFARAIHRWRREMTHV